VYKDKNAFLRELGPKKTGGVKIMKNYKIAVAGTGARDIIGSTKKNHDN